MKNRLIALACGLSVCGLAAIAAAPRAAEVAAASAVAAPSADAWTVDNVHSSVIYRIKHMGVSNFYGRFNTASGTFSFDPAAPESASFDITIDAASIDSNSQQRDGHLKSPDFFNVKEHPSITFKSTSVAKAGDAFELKGDLTMLGVTKPVTAKLTWGGTGDNPRAGKISGFEAQFTIKRSDFGMNYGVQQGALGDEVALFVAIEGAQKK